MPLNDKVEDWGVRGELKPTEGDKMDSKERFDKEVQAVRMDSWLLLLDDAVRRWLADFSKNEKNREREDYEGLVGVGKKIISAFHEALCIYKPYDDQAAQESAIWSELEECWWGIAAVMAVALKDGKKELSVTPDDIEEWWRWTDCRATPLKDKPVQLWFRFAAAENAVQRFSDWGAQRPNNPKWLVCAPTKQTEEPAAARDELFQAFDDLCKDEKKRYEIMQYLPGRQGRKKKGVQTKVEYMNDLRKEICPALSSTEYFMKRFDDWARERLSQKTDKENG